TSNTLQDFLRGFDTFLSNRGQVALAGRVMSLRGQGGIMFADIFDGTERVQVVLQKEDLGGLFSLFADTFDMGDFVQVSGLAYVTKRGAKSLLANEWNMLAKSILPIPDSWYGLKDEELKLRERYLSILLDPELRALFERRQKFWKTIRDFYLERGFYE